MGGQTEFFTPQRRSSMGSHFREHLAVGRRKFESIAVHACGIENSRVVIGPVEDWKLVGGKAVVVC